MPDEFSEELIEELEPVDPGVVTPEEALDASDSAVEGSEDATLIVNPAPVPLGQTMAWDFDGGVMLGSARGPHMVRGEAALKQWIEKCLRTHVGAHPIHPEGYGMRIPITHFLGKGEADVEVGELEQTIRDALLFHPAIKDVTDFEATWQEEDVTGDAGLELAFRVVRDDDTTFLLNTTLSTGEVLTGVAA